MVRRDVNDFLVADSDLHPEHTSKIIPVVVPIIAVCIIFIIIYYMRQRMMQQPQDAAPPPRQSQDVEPPSRQPQDAAPPPRQPLIDPSTAFCTYAYGSDSIRHSTIDLFCPICRDDFEVRDIVSDLPCCRHVYHTDCLKEWFSVSTRADCPICRYIFVAADSASSD